MTVLELNFEIAAAALERPSLPALRLIRSVIKRVRFYSCLGIATDGLICPIGPAGLQARTQAPAIERSRGGCVCAPVGPPARN
ncbi:hypothetical protein [Rhodopila sp.]|uniref:hypothetical protein n=1 Tax=Rhodopila sp. TaxID=2480087 RepID=UPI003D109AB4